MKKFKRVLSCFSLSLFIILIFSLSLLGQDKKEPKSDTTGKKITRLKIGDTGIILESIEGLKEIKNDSAELIKLILGMQGIVIESLETAETTSSQINIKTPERSVTIKAEQGGIVKFWEDITIEDDESVISDVVAIGGNIRVKGMVKGSVVAIGGNVYVSSTAVITEDAVSVGGRVIREPGAVIKGENVGVTLLPRDFLPGEIIGIPRPFYIHHGLSFILTFLKILFLFFLGIIVLAIVPKNVQKIKDRITQSAWKSGFIGILGEILILPVFIILLITIIGIPVALIILPLGILIGILLGYISVSLLVGEKLKQSTNLKPQTQMMTLALGILAVEFASLLSSFLRIFWDFFSALALIFAVIGFMITYVVITIGFGGAIQTLLGTRPKEKPLPATPEPAQPQT